MSWSKAGGPRFLRKGFWDYLIFLNSVHLLHQRKQKYERNYIKPLLRPLSCHRNSQNATPHLLMDTRAALGSPFLPPGLSTCCASFLSALSLAFTEGSGPTSSALPILITFLCGSVRPRP